MVVERDLCPICCEAITAADKRFKPCSCGFRVSASTSRTHFTLSRQICIWCYRKIEESDKPSCPKCRRNYTGRFSVVPTTPESSSEGDASDEQGANYKDITYEVDYDVDDDKEDFDEDLRSSSRASSHTGQYNPKNTTTSPKDQSSLKDVRVVRRDLCYVVGMPLETVSDEGKLKSFEFFGKYGRVVNIIVNRNPNFKSPDKRKSCAVYVTYSNRDEAKAAIMDLDDALYESRRLRASYGTTKYCSSFLKGCRCQNRTCFYLHERGAEEDSFTVDQLNQVKESSRGLTCSTLLAAEFQDAASWKRDSCLFGKDKKITVAYFLEDQFGRTRPPLPNMVAEITQLRKKLSTLPQASPPALATLPSAPAHTCSAPSVTEDPLSPPEELSRAISLVVLPPPPNKGDCIVHPALHPSHLLPSLQELGLPHNLQSSFHQDALTDLRALGLELSGEVIVPTSLPASAPSRLIQSYRVTPADQMARARPDVQSSSSFWDSPPGFAESVASRSVDIAKEVWVQSKREGCQLPAYY